MSNQLQESNLRIAYYWRALMLDGWEVRSFVIRDAGVVQLLFFLGQGYIFISVWLGEDQKPNTMKAYVWNRLDYILKMYQLLYIKLF